MTKAKVSIIIPIYNVEKYLHRCLDSVLNQTFQEWTAICVDDGSTDRSGEIADEYSARDKRFVVIHKKNGGVSDARNVGIQKVKSEYLMFLDSDDCIHPQTIEILYSLAEREYADLVSYRYIYGKSDDKMPDWFSKKYDINNIKTRLTDNLLLCATNRDKGINSWRVQQCFSTMHLFKFDVIKSIKFEKDIHLLEDFVFWSNVLFHRPRAIITKIPLYSYTINPNSLLHTTDYVKSAFNLIRAIKISYANLKRSGVSWANARRWKARFMWDILSRVYAYSKHIADEKSLHDIAQKLIELKHDGVFDNPPDLHAWRYKRRILKFISKNG